MNDDLRSFVQHVTWRNIAIAITMLGYAALMVIGVLWVAAQAWQSS